MSNLDKKFLIPTPAGAYYLAQDNTESWQKTVLKKLFSNPQAMELNDELLQKLFISSDKDKLKVKLKTCEELQLIEVVTEQFTPPLENIEETLNGLIRHFSQKEKVLLTDSQGLCIANYGFPAEMLEEISVLSADIAIMHKRRALNINKKLGLNSQAWSIVDASGNSCLGFWPLNINDEVFVLALEGFPFFNHPALVTLVWILFLRYGNNSS